MPSDCYITGCGESAEYRVEGWPMGTRVEACRHHISTAADYFTTNHRPVLVMPLRLT